VNQFLELVWFSSRLRMADARVLTIMACFFIFPCMPGLKTSRVTEQAAAHLREELRKGRWTGLMPGRRVLARDLGVSQSTVQGALDLLEAEGVLLAEGLGKRRRINVKARRKAARLNIRILLYDRRELAQFESRNLRYLLQQSGHVVEYAEKDLHELRMDARRVAAFVRQQPADAWVVNAGPRAVLEWFAEQPLPAFALFGQKAGLPIAGASPRKIPALIEAVRRLAALGHRRMVMIVHEEWRKPAPGIFQQAFLDELEALGVATGPYNLPEWEDSPEGLCRGLDSLLSLTPPTALIVSEPKLFVAVRDHLAQRGFVSPRDISLICDDPDPVFSWCRPTVAHIRWSHESIVRRVLRWAENVAHGKDDRRQTFTLGKYIDGGTVGPAAIKTRS
jgi:DNA-binding LacI/PurR family transcriptional regulator/DNA-binding transcriptional regulator YhcF (GntR family)